MSLPTLIILASLSFIALIIYALFSSLRRKPQGDLPINFSYNARHDPDFSHNYILFKDAQYRLIKKFHEYNGWLMLEAILRQKLQLDLSEKFKNILSQFGDGTGLYGWWTLQGMLEGQDYFTAYKNIMTPPDIDDTGWGHKYNGTLIDAKTIEVFLSSHELPPEYVPVCARINCPKNNVIRIWDPKIYRNEVNIVCTANALSSLDLEIPKNKMLFLENQKLLNHIIENENYHQYFRYYEPLIAGTFCILFYDAQYRRYLSGHSRAILLKDLRKNYTQLNKSSLVAKIGVSEETFKDFYNMNFAAHNDLLPSLMLQYSAKHFLKEPVNA